MPVIKFKKSLKSPILVVRDQKKINEEYSDLVSKLGLLSIDLEGIEKAEAAQEARREVIYKSQQDIFERIKELSNEMSEAQKELDRKKAQASAQAEVQAPEQQAVAQ